MSYKPTYPADARVPLGLIKRLASSDTRGAATLAEILGSCSIANPCRSRACPVCGGVFQAAAVATTKDFIREAGKRGRKSQLTLISSASCLEPDALSVEACLNVIASIKVALDRASIPPCLGSLDISFNEDAEGEIHEHWCIHSSLVALDWISKPKKKALKEALGTSAFVNRPSVVVALDENVAGLKYQFKSERSRRVSFINKTDIRKPFRDAKPRPLRPHQAIKLALVEHALGFDGELLIHGIERGAVWDRLEAAGWPRDGPK